MLAACITVLIV